MFSRYPEYATTAGFVRAEVRDASQSAKPLLIGRFVDAHRHAGYRVADIDPLRTVAPARIPELDPGFHGLSPDEPLDAPLVGFETARTVGELERQLKQRYCGAVALDCSGVRDETRRRWLFGRLESAASNRAPAPEQQQAVLAQLLAAESWERIVAGRFAGAKRFSLEGCESLIPLLAAVIDTAARHRVGRLFLGMPHRGRLNALVNVMGMSATQILARLDPDSALAATQADLPYHLGGIARRRAPHGEITVQLAHNPSHLQSVYPVVVGMARAYQDAHGAAACLPVVVHGDAAFAGQGVVTETLNLARNAGYSPAGTLHVIVNNQIGFTTPNRMNAEAHTYCTDVARSVDAPVLRVNADRPDEVLRAVAIAFDYRTAFHADIVIDLIGYRRLGHSEHDIPALTQPMLQAAIDAHPGVAELYHASLDGVPPLDALREAAEHALLHDEASHDDDAGAAAAAIRPLHALSLARLRGLTAELTRVPPGARLHEFVAGLIDRWRDAAAGKTDRVDWSFAESLAYASLLDDGFGVRLSGMDVGRGTFMHRHAVWHLQDGGADAGSLHTPLGAIAADHHVRFDIVNSPLTEEAVLGFEYGYSVATRDALTIWEAQFGDFVNGAQVFVDQYLAAGEQKWGYRSRLTVLLPHGHEGVGPEHSSGYLGRFLQLCADENLRVVCPSTSAQWFHLLRQQAAARQPKPLVVMSPKSQLYGNARSHSSLTELLDGTFATVIADPSVSDAARVRKVVLSSGKFHYALQEARDAAGDASVALVRVEQLYPFPQLELACALAAFGNLETVVWAQEEDVNQGAWRFVRDELEAVLPAGCRLSAVCRTLTASGAHASVRAHQAEQQRLVARALGPREAAPGSHAAPADAGAAEPAEEAAVHD
ncbi:2-oxoglutarate dehydrogenase E1 component [Burkholderia glumae]|uniref:2-oxoglutarate dehydrogenase E1 component n=2 Tax=Burkholderia glumae TaxID=337 RepID=UPI000C270DDA|nr:2-oxoglutarate dehydrogenase E1 component [Burkholderia glumae]MCM2494745.1 2-oxoglutarate dehydrogenase E1 component [Burkholderia glumae]MCM2545615.1 2-oxoglutarate dehydrogenase E1 component [Burkholderia glumae]MCM2551438.1 2-oxoglutarate dehydrogenase E1 component [Burkholderia glumae]MCQ0033178.1 2-oxoglutarate dehydrogenase E1 component [Burkholderia glumae]MCQ0038936.1 2-oxoglutarate dehydrogenase E1 component [Burkholderia glumae]